MTALDAGDEDDDGDDDGGDDGRRGRDDDPVQLLGALPDALGPDLAALLVGDVTGRDLQLLQGDHADDDAFLPERGIIVITLYRQSAHTKNSWYKSWLNSRFSSTRIVL